MRNVALRCQLAPGLLADLPVMPVGLVINEALLVVEQRVEHHQAGKVGWVLSGVVTADAAAETGTEQRHWRGAGLRANVSDGRPDVAEDAGDGQVFLVSLAFAMAAQVAAQRHHPGLRQPISEPDEETALLTSDATAVHQDGCLTCAVRQDEGAAEVETARSTQLGSGLPHVDKPIHPWPPPHGK